MSIQWNPFCSIGRCLFHGWLVKFEFRYSTERGIFFNERLLKPTLVLQSAKLLSVDVHWGDQGLVRYLRNFILRVCCLCSTKAGDTPEDHGDQIRRDRRKLHPQKTYSSLVSTSSWSTSDKTAAISLKNRCFWTSKQPFAIYFLQASCNDCSAAIPEIFTQTSGSDY